MATTAKEYIELRSSLLASDPDIDEMISEADKETGQGYGDARYKAVALLSMHWLELKKRSDSSGSETTQTGVVKSKKEGDLAVSYDSGGKFADEFYSQTPWGIELMELNKKTFFRYGNQFVI